MTQTKLGIASLAAGALSVCLALTGCGGSSAPQTVTGHVSADALVSSVSLKDSSVPTNERTSAADADGSFSFDVNGLTPPFTLTAVDAAGTTLQALAKGAGQTNIDALTTIAVAMAGENLVLGASSFDDGYESMLRNLRTVLAPLFSHYGVRFGEDMEESRAFRAMLKEVTFDVTAGTLTVTNKATGGVIFKAPLSDLSSGVLHPENIPGGTVTPPPVIDGAALYAAKCAGCHGPLATSSKKGRTAAQITAANMTQGLSAAEVQAVANALAVTTPPACTYTTGAWGACQSNGTQTRTVSASPSGCTGTPPATSQACTFVPPVVACTSFTYSAWGTCSAAGSQTRTVVSSSPAGCTGGTRVLTQSCTPPALDGAALYAAKCAGCHGPLATSAKAGRTATQITAANMTQGLSAAEVQAVAAALATVATPPPATDGTALYNQYCSGCHGTSMKGKSASTIQSAINSVGQMSSLKSLTSAQIQAISTAR
ncbi:MAG: c-type cytochrome [Anaeromyxobacteraceae bacterium]